MRIPTVTGRVDRLTRPYKTKVVYCKDIHRKQEYDIIQFDFLGYTFRPRRSKDRYGRVFVNFTPAIRRSAAKSIRQTMRSWRLQLKSDKSIKDLSHMFGLVIQGWISYYCKFHPSALRSIANHLDQYLARWAIRKFKRLRGHQRRAMNGSVESPNISHICFLTGWQASYHRLGQ